MKNVISGIMLLILLMGTLILAFNVQPVKANETIYIRADGSVEGTTYIQTTDNVTYVFVADINDSIVVERNSIIIDGNGYTLQGGGNGTGIDLTGRENVTVQNTQIKAFGCGIWLNYSSSSTISGNNITNNFVGIELAYSNYTTISENNVTANNYCGIALLYSSSNTLADNIMADNTYNFLVFGSGLSDYVNDVDASNTVDGRPVYYWIDRRDMAVPLDAGTVVLVNCTRITVQNLNLTSNGQGILLLYTTNSTITKSNMKNNLFFGIVLLLSNYTAISGNNITSNYYGITLGGSSSNTISGNNITSNYYGGIGLSESSNNSVQGNNITNNNVGIYLDYSSSNKFYHNNFIDNTLQVSVYAYQSTMNTWDVGYPSGGNYWSDYPGEDYYSGPYQNETDSDGIGDTPYAMDSNNEDRYPLINPWQSPDIAILSVTPSKTSVGQGFTSQIYVTTQNWGWNTETFNVTAYVDLNTTIIGDEIAIGMQNVTLTSGNSTTLVFTWDTSGFAKGTYTISAVAYTVPGETYTTDNTCTDGTVYVGIPSDINGDGTVDIFDAIILSKHFGHIPPDAHLSSTPEYNECYSADINSDTTVDIYDAILLAKYFGKTDP